MHKKRTAAVMHCYFCAFALATLLFTGVAWAEGEPLPPVQKMIEITGRYALGAVRDVQEAPSDAEIGKTVLAYAQQKKLGRVQVAWFEKGKKKGQGVLAVGETGNDGQVAIMRPGSTKEAQLLEKMLGYVTTPAALSQAYLENQVVADDDFQGETVIFESVVSEIAKGAFNRPYVFFPTVDGSMTGLTCYFDIKSPELRRIRKGSQVLVRGVVKGFLMQDVILEQCEIIQIR